MMSNDPVVHEQIVRDVLGWSAQLDFRDSPPAMGQKLYRRLRQLTGIADPYHAAKVRQNAMAGELLSELRQAVLSAADPLALAARIAVAGNVIDLGVHENVSQEDLRRAVELAAASPLVGDWPLFAEAIRNASSVVYLADNAGEIVFDRLLIEQLGPQRVTLVVRGAPVLNDVTMKEAEALGLRQFVEVIDNGSDAPGTILEDCSALLRDTLLAADLVISKGQGNFETLSDVQASIFFLFKAKCRVIADYAGVPLDANVVLRSSPLSPHTIASHSRIPGGLPE